MKDLLKIQGTDGNWNYDSYMMATHEGREPIFRTCKEKDFLCNKKIDGEYMPANEVIKC